MNTNHEKQLVVDWHSTVLAQTKDVKHLHMVCNLAFGMFLPSKTFKRFNPDCTHAELFRIIDNSFTTHTNLNTGTYIFKS